MNVGLPQQLAIPDEIYDYPANRFVAEFIGSPPMNLLPAEIVYGEIVALDVWRIPDQSNVATGPVDLGLRPESLILGGERGYPTEVFLVEPHSRPEIGSTVLMNAESEGIRLFDRTNGKALNA